MSSICATAENLKVVKAACQRFLGLMALDCLLDRGMERFKADLMTAGETDEDTRAEYGGEDAGRPGT